MSKGIVRVIDLKRAVADLAFKSFKDGKAIGSASDQRSIEADFQTITSYRLVQEFGNELCIEVDVKGDLQSYRFSIKVSGARK